MPRTWQRIMQSTLYVLWFITPNFQIRFMQVLSFDVQWKKWYWIRSNATWIYCRFLSYYQGYTAYVVLQIHTLSEILHTRTKIIIIDCFSNNIAFISRIAIFNPYSPDIYLFQNDKPKSYWGLLEYVGEKYVMFLKEDPIYPVK